MKETTDTCASCRRFPLHVSMAAGGAATCEGYERPAAWNDRACVLYLVASDKRQRADLVKQLRQKESDGKDTPAATA